MFIYMSEKPTHTQVEELEALDVVVYLDSWIPPVGSHSDGFFLALVPIKVQEQIATKDFINRLESAEQYLEPQQGNHI